MTTLEKILQDIKQYETIMEEAGVSALCPGWINEIIRKNIPENDGWIPCDKQMPEEHDSIFAKFKGTDRWINEMFEKISKDVNVTVEYENGKRNTITMHTLDGKWNYPNRVMKQKAISWKPLPEPDTKK